MKTLILLFALLIVGISPSYAATDIPNYMLKCFGCHTFYEGEKNKIGPNLFGVMNRKAGSVRSYTKYRAMKDVGFTWTDGSMNLWLKDSRKFASSVLGSRSQMIIKIKDVNKRKQIIDFLNTLK